MRFIWSLKKFVTSNCHRCGSPLVHIDSYGDRLTGCLECNRWRGDKHAFIIELTVDDWEALGKLRNAKWTLRHRKDRATEI